MRNTVGLGNKSIKKLLQFIRTIRDGYVLTTLTHCQWHVSLAELSSRFLVVIQNVSVLIIIIIIM